LITENLLPEQQSNYGLSKPRLLIAIGLANGNSIRLEVGDTTPGGKSSYIRLAGSTSVYTIDQSWCDVLETLVLDPPYSD